MNAAAWNENGISRDAIETEITAEKNDEILVAALALHAVDLDAWQLDVLFDPAELEFVEGYEETPDLPNFLKSKGGATLWMPPVETAPGKVRLAATLIGSHLEEAPDGSGVIALLKFRVVEIADKTSAALSDVRFLDSERDHDIIADTMGGRIKPPDTTRPSVEIASPNEKILSSEAVTVLFSEPVTGFEAPDLRICNGGITDFSGDGAAYSFMLHPLEKGAVRIDIPAHAAEDESGNGNTAAVPHVLECVKNQTPVISGTPPGFLHAGTACLFTPSASDPDPGDRLIFRIENKPEWAEFDAATGALSGTPTNADIGTTRGIIITVIDPDDAEASLPAFHLTVGELQKSDPDGQDAAPPDPSDLSDSPDPSDPPGENGGSSGNGSGCFIESSGNSF
ncbi:MAG: hypothetical protein CSB33_04730 [Desulfobacterales bacterium]|nr:MAG: hypothetical protein CSB33_04730 [Desulfobacterales bacterium]